MVANEPTKTLAPSAGALPIKYTRVKAEQEANAWVPMAATVAGSVTVCNCEQPLNA